MPIRLLYVCDSMPLMHHPDAHKYLGRIRSCLTVNSLLEEDPVSSWLHEAKPVHC